LESDPKVIVPLVVQILADKEQPLYAGRMLETVVDLGENAVPFLNAALENEEAAFWACLAIEELEETAAATAPHLIELLSKPISDSLRVQALLAVAKLGEVATTAKPIVLKSLSEKSSQPVQIAAAFAAGSLGFDEATRQLEKTRSSDEPLLQLVSLWALAKLAPEDTEKQSVAVNHLIGRLKHHDADIRLAAAKGLASLKYDRSTVQLKLTELVSEADPIVLHNLIDTFANLGEQSAEPAGRALANEKLRDIAIEVLIRIGPDAKAALPKLLEALPSSTGDFRQKIQITLGQLGPDAAPAAVELTKSFGDDRDLLISALTALGLIGEGASSVAPQVLAQMDDIDDPGIKVLAAWCLTQIGSSDQKVLEKAIPVLTKGLEVNDRQLQAEVLLVLRQLGASARSASGSLEKFASSCAGDAELHQLALDAIEAIK
ncbi:MAG: signal transduction protein, partial [Planctomycetota bacterium]